MRRRERRALRRTVLWTTVIFYILLLAGGCLLRAAPVWRQHRAEAALIRGDTALARQLAEKLSDADAARAIEMECDYRDALALLESGEEAAAEKRFLSLGGYADAQDLARECVYRRGEKLALAGDFTGAEELFASVAGYRDGAERVREMRYRQAEALRAAGDATGSFRLFIQLGDYSDAAEQAVSLAAELTGEPDPEKARQALEALPPEEVERLARLRSFRESLPRNVIDVGFAHVAARKSDGSVVSCGDDSFGQCGTEGWTEITAVACGAWHTVGLRADGTVAAVGRNSEGQCRVEEWTGVVEIAAMDYGTLALCSDGTIRSCGFVDLYMLPDWVGAERIFAGSSGAGALRDGAALLSQKSARSPELTDLIDLALNTGYAVGLRSDGTVVSPQAALPDWTDIAAVSAGSTGILALTAEGRVLSYAFRDGDRLDTSSLRDVAAMAAGGTFSAFVHRDGTVTVLGRETAGLSAAADWDLF